MYQRIISLQTIEEVPFSKFNGCLEQDSKSVYPEKNFQITQVSFQGRPYAKNGVEFSERSLRLIENYLLEKNHSEKSAWSIANSHLKMLMLRFHDPRDLCPVYCNALVSFKDESESFLEIPIGYALKLIPH